MINTPDHSPVQWESVKQLAARTPFSVDWIYEKVKDGTVPGYKVGGIWVFNPFEVDAFILGLTTKKKSVDSSFIKKLVVNKMNLGKNPASGKSKIVPFQISEGK